MVGFDGSALRAPGRGFPTDFPVVGSSADRPPLMLPWLPYRFPRGRLARARQRRAAPWLPYRFPRGRLCGSSCGSSGRGFPTDFPVVGLPLDAPRRARRGFPTDFPVVGSSAIVLTGALLAVASLPISPW